MYNNLLGTKPGNPDSTLCLTECWNGYNEMPMHPSKWRLSTFFKHPGQTWIQAQMVQDQVIFKHYLSIIPCYIH